MINYYDEHGYLLEGDQAEAYKAKKKAEKSAANSQRRADVNRTMGRAAGLAAQAEKEKDGKYASKSFQDKWEKIGSGKSGSKVLDNASKYAAKHMEGDDLNIYNKKNADALIKTFSAADAMMRHERRHPTKESVMLSVNGIELF